MSLTIHIISDKTIISARERRRRPAATAALRTASSQTKKDPSGERAGEREREREREKAMSIHII